MFQHMEWADATVWKALLSVPSAHEDRRLRELLYHLHMVQHSFLDVWKGREQGSPGLQDFSDLHSIREWGRGRYGESMRFLDTITVAELENAVVIPWAARFEASLGTKFNTPTLAETMFQVTSHSTYHRGQVNVRLRELGGTPPLIDFIAWVWTGKPEADWT